MAITKRTFCLKKLRATEVGADMCRRPTFLCIGIVWIASVNETAPLGPSSPSIFSIVLPISLRGWPALLHPCG
jgi:hypothetical protein